MPKPKGKETLRPFSLRIPEDLYETLAALAEADRRAINSEIIVLLREAITHRHAQQAQHATDPGK